MEKFKKNVGSCIHWFKDKRDVMYNIEITVLEPVQILLEMIDFNCQY